MGNRSDLIIDLRSIPGTHQILELIETIEEASGDFTPTTSGTYYLAFHTTTSQAGSNGLTFLFDYTITQVCSKTAVDAANLGAPTLTKTDVGITTLDRADGDNNWLNNINNGYLALESNSKGLVLPRTFMRNITNPQEGMIIWEENFDCLMLYKGEEKGWKCIQPSCNE